MIKSGCKYLRMLVCFLLGLTWPYVTKISANIPSENIATNSPCTCSYPSTAEVKHDVGDVLDFAIPMSLKQSKNQMAKLLTKIWREHPRDSNFMTVQGISVSRTLLDDFINSARDALDKSFGPVCIDWDNKNPNNIYMNRFPSCSKKFIYKYRRNETGFHDGEDSFGTIVGDFGKDMSHVPDNLINGAIVTQVFEHVPEPWIAARNLYRVMSRGGILIFSVPFSYNFHRVPGDLWRYSPMGAIHLMESAGFHTCQISTDGYRAVQMHSLGLSAEDIPQELWLDQASNFSLYHGGCNYNFIFQKPSDAKSSDKSCSIPKVALRNELSRELLKGTDGYWPEKMPNFPLFGYA